MTSGAQDETVDSVGVAPPHQLGDRAAHRIADRHERVEVEHVGQGCDVVGAVFQPESPMRADASTVATVWPWSRHTAI